MLNVNRRTFLRGGTSLLAFSGTVLSRPARAQSTGNPVRGGILVIAQDANPPSLDPHKSAAFATTNITEQIYGCLLRWDDSGTKVEPDLAASYEMVDDLTYRRLIRAVLVRPPRRPSPPGERVVIPGHAGLRNFSAARESLVKAACGGAWRSYLQHSHWRIVVPVSRGHQHRAAGELLDAVEDHDAPLVHLLRFPSLGMGALLTMVEIGVRNQDTAS